MIILGHFFLLYFSIKTYVVVTHKKSLINFSYFSTKNNNKKQILWVLIRGASNEYPQHMFLWRNKKKYSRIITKYSSLTQAMSQ